MVDPRAAHLALFEARAVAPFPDHPRDRLFFQQLDAWTHPTLVAFLRDPAFVAGLSSPARARFVAPILDVFPLRHAASMWGFASSLFDVVRTRAELLLEGRDERPDLDLADGIWEPWSDGEAALRAIAGYLRAIIELHFVGGAAGSLDFGRLCDAFCRFASGQLAFIDPRLAQTDPIAAGLNAEPDSAYFFCWAEIALQAADRAPAEEPFWFELARLFVALQDVFLATYGHGLPARELVRYTRENRRLVPELTLEAMRVHVARFEPFADPTAVKALARRHAANVLFAGRDEFIRPPRSVATTGAAAVTESRATDAPAG